MIFLKVIIPEINGSQIEMENLISCVRNYENDGADEIYLYNYSSDEKDQEVFLQNVRKVMKTVDIPIILGVYVERFEDVKKAFYTGAKSVVIQYEALEDKIVLREVIKRFGNENIIVALNVVTQKALNVIQESGGRKIMCKQYESVLKIVDDVCVYVKNDSLEQPFMKEQLAKEQVKAYINASIKSEDILPIKYNLKVEKIEVNTFESAVSFDEFKLDSNGLIPAIVQDYKTNQVLMMAYMNKESFENTIKTGRMTYFSRSRQELWLKGDTSGHYQYVKELFIDCDKDTILAKVRQVGAACHTGNYSCFFNDLMKKEYDKTNPYTVLEDVYNRIMRRKEQPKEGSYTNYLFDKGIDKILKKCGEEATEMLIAAKNTDTDELKYEISDLLYHLMVLMAQKGIDWKDISKELAHRR